MATENIFPAYDSALAERAVAQVDPILWGCGTGGLGIPLGSRVETRNVGNAAEYELFRTVTRIPKRQRDIIEICMNVYYRMGPLRNVVDMMASFGCQGIQVLHPLKSREKFYKYWFHTVQGTERSERFLNNLYRGGNVVVKKTMGKVNAADLRDMQRGYASLDAETNYERRVKPRRGEIPIQYTFLNPYYIETAGGDLATFLGHPVYTLRVPNFIITSIRTPKTPTEKQMVADLPEFIRGPIQRGEKFITLDNDKLSVYHYMKDDWQTWAMPITYSILADIILYEKMKLADMAALEGAISHIRLWKLGNLDKGIQVGPVMFQRLSDALQSNVGGGAMDLLWDAAIELVETSTEVAKFLGGDKYEPVLKSIYAGLGIPQSLAGGGAAGAGFTNNAISLKTLIERLQYGRDLLTHFWNNELRILQEALGDRQPARIVFDNMSLYDEAAEKMLWFQLYDRHLVDDATIQEKFGMVPDVVSMRIKREEKQRDDGKKPPKATPFHDPQADHELTKIALQQGTLAPTEAGVDKKPKKAGDKSTLDFQAQQAQKDRQVQEKQAEQQAAQNQELHEQKLAHKDAEHKAFLPIKKDALRKKTQVQLQNRKKGVPGEGRPRNSRDKSPRKSPRQSPRVKSAVDMFALQQWARDTLKAITPAAHKEYLARKGKRTLRSLTTAESDELEDLKFRVLCNITDRTHSVVTLIEGGEIFSLPRVDAPLEIYAELVKSYTDREGVQPPVDEQRDMRASAYAIWCMNQS